jgi:fatty acid-binding protein DegV
MSIISVPYSSNISSSVSVTSIDSNYVNHNLLTVDGNKKSVDIRAALVVEGRDVLKELDEMRDALLLLKRDVSMEAKYPRLKELKDQYEAELEKYKTFERLK